MTDKPLSGWLQREVPFATNPEQMQEALYTVALAEASSKGAIDRRVALFVREAERGTDVWLLSPAASRYAPLLPGPWAPAHHPEKHGWTLLYSAGVTHEELGLKTVRDFDQA